MGAGLVVARLQHGAYLAQSVQCNAPLVERERLGAVRRKQLGLIPGGSLRIAASPVKDSKRRSCHVQQGSSVTG